RNYEEWFVTSLIVDDGQCRGCVAMDIRTGELHAIAAKTTIICTGGLGRVYEPSTNALICTGDGISLAYRAGAPIMDMEMVQIHPTTLKGSGVLITEGARGEGAYLLNKDGERFMEKYAPNLMELASRDVVSRAEQIEINEGRGVHGANRVGANSLLDTLVFGRRASEHAVPWLRGQTFKPVPESVVEQDRKMICDVMARPTNGDRVAKIRRDMGVSMSENVGMFRSPDKLEKQLEELKALRKRYE